MSNSSKIPESVMENIRRWRGGIDDRVANIDNIIQGMTEKKNEWGVSTEMLDKLTESREKLGELMGECGSSYASSNARHERNSLLKALTDYCRKTVRIWAYGQYEAGVMSALDVHRLAFLLPGEQGGRRGRHDPTHELASVKVKLVNAEFVRIILDRAVANNSALVTHSWPHGVRNAIIVILTADGATEVVRQVTSRLHNTISMPEGSHGKAFIVKAAFLKHVDDTPRFSNPIVFSMPLTVVDFDKVLNHIEVPMSEMERLRIENRRLRLENERLLAENAQLRRKEG
jgi:hypothetical protein